MSERAGEGGKEAGAGRCERARKTKRRGKRVRYYCSGWLMSERRCEVCVSESERVSEREE